MAPVRLAKSSYFLRVSGSIASRYSAAYHYRFMHTARSHLSKSPCLLFLALLAFSAALCPGSGVALAQESNEILPPSQVRAGMQGYAYTIFAGDQVEKFNLEVIGVLENFLGPKQSIILVQLKGPKVEHTGVVAGMSGSPVYLDGKLAGALSLKLGVFTKEPIAGVTPIQDVLNPPSQTAAAQAATQQFGLPSEASTRTGLPSGSALEPIETPLVFSGFQPATLQQFANQLQGYGIMATQGGTASPRPDDGRLVAGDMAGEGCGHTAASMTFSWPSPRSAGSRKIPCMAKAPHCIFPARFACKAMRRYKLKTPLPRAIRSLPMDCLSP